MAKKSIYTKRLGSVVARNARSSSSGRYHVIPSHTAKWNVVSEGSVKPVKTFTTKDQAVSFAKQVAVARHAGEVIIHGVDGRILNRVSF
jgi:hypothetical protein